MFIVFLWCSAEVNVLDVTGVIIGDVIISVWVFNLHFHVLLGMWPSSYPAGV